MLGSFFRTPALLSFIGAVAVAVILSMIFLQGGEGVSPGARLYALGGIVLLVGLGIFLTAREARFLRVPPLTEITRACDFSDNVGFPFGRRRFYAIRNPAFADAFTRANQDRLWTDAIRKRDDWIGNCLRGADRRCADRVVRARLISGPPERVASNCRPHGVRRCFPE